MHWDHLFEDLEGQLTSEWEAERAALDAEAERLRIAKIALIDRIRTLRGTPLRIGLASGEALPVVLRDVGADWLAAEPASEHRLVIVPIAAVSALDVDLGQILQSLEPAEPTGLIRSRMTLGFVLRDLARRRASVRLTTGTQALHGTVDRAGADHLDLALHEDGEPRRASAVQGLRIIPFAALSWLSVNPQSFATVG